MGSFTCFINNPCLIDPRSPGVSIPPLLFRACDWAERVSSPHPIIQFDTPLINYYPIAKQAEEIMGIKCPKCHFDNPDDTIYCGKCATLLEPSDEISVSQTETLKTPAEESSKIYDDH